MLGEQRCTEEDTGHDPASSQRRGEGPHRGAEAHDVLGMEQLDDGAARCGKKGQEREETYLSAESGDVGGPEKTQAPDREHEPGSHAEDPLRAVPGREHGRSGPFGEVSLGAALVHVLGEVRIVTEGRFRSDRGRPPRRCAPIRAPRPMGSPRRRERSRAHSPVGPEVSRLRQRRGGCQWRDRP